MAAVETSTRGGSCTRGKQILGTQMPVCGTISFSENQSRVRDAEIETKFSKQLGDTQVKCQILVYVQFPGKRQADFGSTGES